LILSGFLPLPPLPHGREDLAKSDRWIARAVGVSNNFVSTLRPEVSSNDTMREGRDGVKQPAHKPRRPKAVGVGHQLVASIRPELDESSSSIREGLDGKSRPAHKPRKPRGEIENQVTRENLILWA